MNLEGTTALVTGAARRVGKAIALRLACLGCDVAVHFCSSRGEAEQTVSAIQELGRKALLVQADLSNQDDAERAAGEVLRWKGGLEILVNSAANFGRAPLGQVTIEDWDFALETNLLGPFWLAQEMGPRMVDAGRGKILNIADISWQSPWPTRLPYCVSKAALVSLTTGLAKAFAPHVQVNAIGPGPVLFPEEYTLEQQEAVIQKTLLKRAGSPEDIADAVEFFCRCDFATGVFLPVDGGQSLHGS